MFWKAGDRPPGLMHIGQGLVCGQKIRDLVNAGLDFTIFLADWHSMINNKYGGDLTKIRATGEYFKHCFTALGLPEGKVHYTWAADLASQWCRRHALTYLRACPLGARTARLALEPIVNLARLLVRHRLARSAPTRARMR